MKIIFKYYGPAILWAFFALILCSLPVFIEEGERLLFTGFDKVVHCFFFFVLSILYCTGSIRKWHTRNIRIEIAMKNTIVLLSYGAFIEVLQSYIFGWRSSGWQYLLADAMGACMGVFGVLVTGNAINANK